MAKVGHCSYDTRGTHKNFQRPRVSSTILCVIQVHLQTGYTIYPELPSKVTRSERLTLLAYTIEIMIPINNGPRKSSGCSNTPGGGGSYVYDWVVMSTEVIVRVQVSLRLEPKKGREVDGRKVRGNESETSGLFMSN